MFHAVLGVLNEGERTKGSKKGSGAHICQNKHQHACDQKQKEMTLDRRLPHRNQGSFLFILDI